MGTGQCGKAGWVTRKRERERGREKRAAEVDMCGAWILKWFCRVIAFGFNVGMGVWALSFPAEYRLLSLAFFIPALTGVVLGLSQSGSRLACVASAMVLGLGIAKLVFAATAVVFANEAARSTSPSSGLGSLVFAVLAGFSGASAISDLIVGCAGYTKWRRHREFRLSLGRELDDTYGSTHF